MEGLNYNISYKEYYININIVNNNCLFFNWNSVNIYTNISEFFGDNKIREDAIKYFKNYIINNIKNEYISDVLDEFNFHINYMYKHKFVAYHSF
jgi:hypothetical protein